MSSLDRTPKDKSAIVLRFVLGTCKHTISPSGFLAPIARSLIATTQCLLMDHILE